jgi:hypothetical protein
MRLKKLRNLKDIWFYLCASLLSVVVFLGVLAGAPVRASAADFTLNLVAGQTLNPGDSLWSPSHLYRLAMQADGNLVLYSMPGDKPFWSSGTNTHPGSVTQMQADGNLVVYAPGHVAVWASNTAGHPGTVLQMQDDSNAVLYAPGHVAIWATGAGPVAGCLGQDGSKTLTKQFTQTNKWYNPVPVVDFDIRAGTSNDTAGDIHLLYYPPARCAWAIGSGGVFADDVWIDRSSDGGHTWTGPLGATSLPLAGGSATTGVFYDSYPYVVRACIEDYGYYYCTAWF